jgi:3-oxoacyl-[acyl-carrier protein] reductase
MHELPGPLPFHLRGRRALVCGASSGIGRAAALALASLGAELGLLARREALLDEVAHEALALGASRVRPLVVDMQDRPSLREAARTLLLDGPVHVLVNNTGGPRPGPILDADEDDFLEAFGRHVLTAHLLVRELLPAMREAGYGRILNVVSLSVREPLPGLGVSNTIRAAMAAWAKTLSMELPPGVTVNCVLPGYIATERAFSLMETVARAQASTAAQVEASWRNAIPEGRLGLPEEVGALLAFLASPAGAYVRGACIPVDGGRLRSL